MTRYQLSQMILRFGRHSAVDAGTVPELFRSSGRALRIDQLVRFPRLKLLELLVTCAKAVESFEAQGFPSRVLSYELYDSVAIPLVGFDGPHLQEEIPSEKLA